MKITTKFLLITFTILFVVIFSVYILEKTNLIGILKESKTNTFSPIIGKIGKDDCLNTAGYTWDSFIRACVRYWEFNNEKRMAARLAVNSAKTSKELTVVDIQEKKCPGCFEVQLERTHEKINVSLINWNVVDTERSTNLEISEEKCNSLNGRIINKSEGSCKKTELNIGYVNEFGKGSFCCIAR